MSQFEEGDVAFSKIGCEVEVIILGRSIWDPGTKMPITKASFPSRLHQGT